MTSEAGVRRRRRPPYRGGEFPGISGPPTEHKKHYRTFPRAVSRPGSPRNSRFSTASIPRPKTVKIPIARTAFRTIPRRGISPGESARRRAQNPDAVVWFAHANRASPAFQNASDAAPKTRNSKFVFSRAGLPGRARIRLPPPCPRPRPRPPVCPRFLPRLVRDRRRPQASSPSVATHGLGQDAARPGSEIRSPDGQDGGPKFVFQTPPLREHRPSVAFRECLD